MLSKDCVLELVRKYTNKTPSLELAFFHANNYSGTGIQYTEKETNAPTGVNETPNVWYFGDINIHTTPTKDLEVKLYSPAVFDTESVSGASFQVIVLGSDPSPIPVVKIENFMLEYIKFGAFPSESSLYFFGWKIIFK